ncbi:MAG TPA: 3-oxoacyl-ACP synthase III [Planctomycetes bacterium]|nr:3-oxoacyl-ACP synthase III [Planctomycetota bacterium]
MRYRDVVVAGIGHALPARAVTSEELEERLAPLYERFRLRAGRLELMSGIRERRFWPPGTRPSEVAAQAGEMALAQSGIARASIGCLIHASVSRDFLEPATASVVHQRLGLAPDCHLFDLSNACLGVLNAMVIVAGMIERGEIEAGLVVAGEDGRPLVDRTIEELVGNDATTKADLKRAFASLTIASGAAAVVLRRASEEEKALERVPGRLLGGAVLAASEHNVLCQGDHSADGAGLLMETDSEAMLQAGNALAARTFEAFLAELHWSRDSIDRIVTHQVGGAHRRLLFETLELDPERDFPTVETLGNIGSVSLPLTLSIAIREGRVERGQSVALLGIGSGLNCMMLGLEW